jgi:uracil permease
MALSSCWENSPHVLRSIRAAVLGGASLILYGMISSVGIRTLAEAKLDFS